VAQDESPEFKPQYLKKKNVVKREYFKGFEDQHLEFKLHSQVVIPPSKLVQKLE
jgi:hypothetical protein